MAMYEFIGNMIGWAVAVTTLGITLWRDRHAMRSERDESVRQSQKLFDKIEGLSREVTKMEVTLTTIMEREDAYGRELTECSTKLRDHEKRIARIETNCDFKK
jgi:chromosome segregation ATPase